MAETISIEELRRIYQEAADAKQAEERAKETRPGYTRNATREEKHDAGITAVFLAGREKISENGGAE